MFLTLVKSMVWWLMSEHHPWCKLMRSSCSMPRSAFSWLLDTTLLFRCRSGMTWWQPLICFIQFQKGFWFFARSAVTCSIWERWSSFSSWSFWRCLLIALFLLRLSTSLGMHSSAMHDDEEDIFELVPESSMCCFQGGSNSTVHEIGVQFCFSVV